MIYIFFFTALGLVVLFRFVPVPLTPLVIIRAAQGFSTSQELRIHKNWVPLEEISPWMQRAVVAAEDARFFEHNGFDYQAIEMAIATNRNHKTLKGASTISQQTAKNLFLWPERSWVRKGLEAYLTVLIESFWPKERILEVYLNVIELGPGVYGVEAAAQKYFRKKACNLTPSQAALMAAVLPNPRKLRIDHPSRSVFRRQRRILRRSTFTDQRGHPWSKNFN